METHQHEDYGKESDRDAKKPNKPIELFGWRITKIPRPLEKHSGATQIGEAGPQSGSREENFHKRKVGILELLALVCAFFALVQSTCATHASNRAYLGVKIAQLADNRTESQMERAKEGAYISKFSSVPIVQMEYLNTGVTPARKVRKWSELTFLPKGVDWHKIERLKASYRPILKSDSSVEDTPKDALLSMPIHPDKPYSRHTVELTQTGQIVFAVYGGFYYQDMLNFDHETRYCFYFSPINNDVTICPVGNWMR